MWLQKGELTRLPWAEESFDGYVAECTLAICGDIRASLQEAQRVLRPGGRLMIADVYDRLIEAASPILSREGCCLLYTSRCV